MNRVNNPAYLIGRWLLNGNAKDTSGKGNDGTWTGTEAYTEYDKGRKLGGDFDGSSYVDAGDIDEFDGISEISLSVWVKVNSSVALRDSVLAKGSNAGDGMSMSIHYSDTQDMFFYFGGAAIFGETSSNNIKQDKWQLWTLTFNGAGSTNSDKAKFYLDGNEQTLSFTGTLGTTTPSSTETFRIGAKSTGDAQEISGAIRDARVYNIALTGDEIKAIFKEGVPEQKEPSQPIDTLPDLGDSTLVASFLNKAVKGTANDYSVSQNNGTPTNVLFNRVGADFNGSTDISVTGLTSTNGTYTFSMWAKSSFADSTTDYLFDTQSGRLIIAWFGNTNGKIGYYDGSWHEPGDAPNDGAWHHIVFLLDGVNSEGKVYIDGTQLGATQTYTSKNIGGNVNIGGFYSGAANNFTGNIKDFRIYEEEKSDSWIKNEHQKGVPDDSLVLHVLDGTKDLSKYNESVTNSGLIVGKDIDCDGTNSLDLGDKAQYDPGTSDFTLSCWAKIPGPLGGNERLITKDDGSTDGYWILVNSSEKIRPGLRAAGDVIATTGNSVLLANTWYHIVAVYDRDGNLEVYLNGVSDETVDISSKSAVDIDPNTVLKIGADSSEKFTGSIKDVKVYSEAKNAGWVKNEYERTRRFY